MSNLHKWLLLMMCISLAACTQDAPKDEMRQDDTQIQVEVEQPDFTLIEEPEALTDEPEVITELAANPGEPTPAPEVQIETYSLADIKGALDGFQLNTEPQYLSCAYFGVKGCEAQTVYEKAQTDKDAGLCDLLSEEEVSSCKDNLWRTLASMENDISLCDNITDGYSKLDCSNSFYLAQAVSEKNEAVCENIKPFVNEVDLVAPTIDPVLDAEGNLAPPIETDPVVIETVGPDNYLLEECKRQVQFAIEFEVVDPVIEPQTPLEAPIPEVEVTAPEAAAPEAVAPEAAPLQPEITFPPEDVIPPEETVEEPPAPAPEA